MVKKYSEEAKTQLDSSDKTTLQTELKKIGEALGTGDIAKVDLSLDFMRAVSKMGKLNPQQKAALAGMDALIEAWKKAPEKIVSTPDVPASE